MFFAQQLNLPAAAVMSKAVWSRFDLVLRLIPTKRIQPWPANKWTCNTGLPLVPASVSMDQLEIGAHHLTATHLLVS
jgi:hypothetical protein